VTGTVNVTPPVVNAGTPQTITQPANSATLNGSATDTGGTIVSHIWTFVSGPGTPAIVNPLNYSTNVTGLNAAGIYTFKLTATDNNNVSSSGNVTVTVNAAPPNQPPVANAGPDQLITFPQDSVIIYGSATDADGTVVAYQWTKISGPSQYNILFPAQPQTVINNLVAGIYY